MCRDGFGQGMPFSRIGGGFFCCKVYIYTSRNTPYDFLETDPSLHFATVQL